MNQEELLEALTTELDSLQFEHFDFDDAYAIGCDLVVVARKNQLAITVDVTVNRQQLFHAALPGTSPDNDQWVVRKNRVAERFFKSSFYIAKLLAAKDKTIEEVYGLSAKDFAPFGGAVPVTVKGAGVIGTVTVSGLPDEEDHKMVVEAIRRHLERHKAVNLPG